MVLLCQRRVWSGCWDTVANSEWRKLHLVIFHYDVAVVLIDSRPDGRIDGALLDSFTHRDFAITCLTDERLIVLFAEGP